MTNQYSNLISAERLRTTTFPGRNLTTEMLSDHSRIILSSVFRRLQTKAQVFSLEKNAAIRTRLTHTLEVALFGQLIAEKVFDHLLENGTVDENYRRAFVLAVENACLLHDIGNPPFGHLGEFAIRDWFDKNTGKIQDAWALGGIRGNACAGHLAGFKNFDGNAQGFRIVSRLQWLNDEFGLNLTCTLLASIIKYLVPAPTTGGPFRNKTGYFETEREMILDIWKRLHLSTDHGLPIQRHPLAFIMEAADDIAFSVNDIEDAIEKHVISSDTFFKSLPPELNEFDVPDAHERNPKLVADGRYWLFRINLVRYMVDQAAKTFAANEDLILSGDFESHLLDLDEKANKAREYLQDFAHKYIYSSHEAIDIELSGFRILQDILDGFLPLVNLPPAEFTRLQTGSLKHGELSLETRLFSLMSRKHLLCYRHFSEQFPKLEPVFRTHLIVDYLSGMTDSHAVKIFNMINGTSTSTTI